MSYAFFCCLALILYTTSRLREGYVEASRNVGSLRRGFVECRVAYAENNFQQVPTQRLRGPTRTGRQPAGAFAVKMHSKKTLLKCCATCVELFLAQRLHLIAQDHLENWDHPTCLITSSRPSEQCFFCCLALIHYIKASLSLSLRNGQTCWNNRPC